MPSYDNTRPSWERKTLVKSIAILSLVLSLVLFLDFIGFHDLFDHVPFEGRHLLNHFVLGFVAAVITAALFSNDVFDSRTRRRRVARRLNELATSAKSTGDVQYRERLVDRLRHVALFERRFDSCYAITLLGDLASSESSERLDLVPTIGECLTRDDPFVRHAAAATLYRLGTRAQAARDQLAGIAEKFQNESAGEFAKRALRNLRAQ